MPRSAHPIRSCPSSLQGLAGHPAEQAFTVVEEEVLALFLAALHHQADILKVQDGASPQAMTGDEVTK